MMQRRSAPLPNGPVIRRILVRCSVTAKLIDSGRTVEEKKFESMRLTNNKISCSYGGQVHRWTKKDVILAR